MGTLLPHGTVFLRRFVSHNMNDPLTNDLELIQTNPHHAFVRYTNEKESTVSLRDLAHAGDVPAPNIFCKEGPTSQDTSTAFESQPEGIGP